MLHLRDRDSAKATTQNPRKRHGAVRWSGNALLIGNRRMYDAGTALRPDTLLPLEGVCVFMEWFNFRRDRVALVVFVLAVVMIASGLAGNSRVFGYAVVLFIGLLAGLGFVRQHDSRTWWPPALATLVLVGSLTGAFAFEAARVDTVSDTVLGFQPGTAFVIYGIWLPAFFTLGVTYVLVFDRLADRRTSSTTGKETS